MNAHTPLPAAIPSSAAGKTPAVTACPLPVTAGASFSDLARSILAADASLDTAAGLNDALRLGEHEFQVATASLANARRTATDPLATDDEANAARHDIAGLTITVERIEAAFKMLTSRHNAFIERSNAERSEAERKAAIDRHAAAADAIRTRYPGLADDLAAMFAELCAAETECARLRLDPRTGSYDSSIGRALGIVGAYGTVGIVWLPALSGKGTHWPLPARR